MRASLSVRVAAAAAGVMLALLPATAAWAATVALNPDHIGATAESFPEHMCTGPFADLPSDKDGWHFVLPNASGDSFVSVTLTFDGGVVNITSTDENNPSQGPGWIAWLDNAGMMDDEKHAYVIADAGWTLLAGTAETSGDGTQEFFNLSHTCPGIPTTPTPKPSGGVPTGGGGSQAAGSMMLGMGALVIAGVAGTGLLLARRRRNSA